MIGAASAGDRMSAEQYPQFGRFDRERAQIEQFVMQRAEAQAIGLDVGTTDVVPLDVSTLETGRQVSYAQIEAADATPKLVCQQHPLTKCGITPRAPH